jgi:hypothetical protein
MRLATMKMHAAVSRARFGKTLGLSTVQLYLQRWTMTPQKPLARARERQPAAIAA